MIIQNQPTDTVEENLIPDHKHIKPKYIIELYLFKDSNYHIHLF